MNKAEFTPGNWEIKRMYSNSLDVKSDGTGICFVFSQDDESTKLANARLIAAAPEMFDFLQIIVDNPAFANEALREKAGELINKITNNNE